MPLLQRLSLRRSPDGRFSFSSSDIDQATPFFSDTDCGDDHDVDGAAAPALPPAHSQLLLSDEDASSAALKGCDHAREPSVDVLSWLLASFGEDTLSSTLPGIVSASSVASLSYSDSDDSSTGTAVSDDEDLIRPSRARGVSFAPTVIVRPIPHSSTLNPDQRGRMFTSSSEVRRNKARNRKEFLYDRCDWRRATEERGMDVDPLTGEEIHPVHRYLSFWRTKSYKCNIK